MTDSQRPDEREVEIFLDALDLPEAQRAAFVRVRCEEDPARRERVLKLLAAHAGADELLGTAMVPTSPTQELFVDEFEPGAEIGAYRLVEEIAEGGFGTVWRAEQLEPVKRRVALKVLKPGLDCREVVTRFEAERQALALMDHANIARVFDGGSTPRGRPFFVMEFVDGEPITRYSERHSLDVTARLELFATVCAAVQHAHQKGVIHRDIKPNNVLVATVDGKPVPKVIDFGIAKAAGVELTDKTLATRGGQMIGTPAYMSPEQAAGSADVDTRCDVYALGVLLYELLTGSPPFDEETIGMAGLAEALRLIRDVEPPRPSARIDRHAATRRTGVLRREVRGDLDWIVMRCLEKQRERRYGSVAVLANEIGRHLRGDPVLAGPPSLSYRAQKFARKHRILLGTTLALAITLISATVISLQQAARANAEATRANKQTTRANDQLARYRTIAKFLEHVLSSIDPAVAKGRDTELLEGILKLADQRIEQLTSGPPEVEASLRRVIGNAFMSLAHFDQAEQQLVLAAEIREQELGESHADTLESLYELGALYLKTEQIEKAEAPLERSLRGRRSQFGDEHELTLDCLEMLANLYRQTERRERAAELFAELERTLADQRGDDHSDTLRVMNNYALVLDQLNRKPEAVERYEHVLALQRQKKGPKHVHTLKTLNNLAGLYQELGREAEAIDLLRVGLDVKREVLRAGDPSILIGMNNLADALASSGQRDEADALWEQAYVLANEHHGERNVYTMTFRLIRARRMYSSEEFEQAEPELRALRLLISQHLGARHRLGTMADSLLVSLLIDTERAAEAEPIVADLAERASKLLPKGDDAHGVYRIQHGIVLSSVGQPRRALTLLREGLNLLSPKAERWHHRANEAINAIESSR